MSIISGAHTNRPHLTRDGRCAAVPAVNSSRDSGQTALWMNSAILQWDSWKWRRQVDRAGIRAVTIREPGHERRSSLQRLLCPRGWQGVESAGTESVRERCGSADEHAARIGVVVQQADADRHPGAEHHSARRYCEKCSSERRAAEHLCIERQPTGNRSSLFGNADVSTACLGKQVDTDWHSCPRGAVAQLFRTRSGRGPQRLISTSEAIVQPAAHTRW
jgi:hypothetical protein